MRLSKVLDLCDDPFYIAQTGQSFADRAFHLLGSRTTNTGVVPSRSVASLSSCGDPKTILGIQLKTEEALS